LSKNREAKELTPAADGATQPWLILEAQLCVAIGTAIGRGHLDLLQHHQIKMVLSISKLSGLMK
jgi:hypothetical protein